MNTLNSYVEGKAYLKEEIEESFLKKGYFVGLPNGKYILKVCGVAIINDLVTVFFPKGFSTKNMTKKNEEEKGFELIKTILKYKSTVQLREEEVDWIGEQVPSIEYINIIQWLIHDYIEHGIYISREKVYEDNGRGKISWDKTIKKKMPFIENDGMKYIDLLTSRTATDDGNLITAIHNNIILECIKTFGMLFKVRIDLFYQDTNLSTTQQIKLLEQKLRTTFITRELNLMKKMIGYLKSIQGRNEDFILVTPYYYYIWEEMLKKIFNNDLSLYSYVPKPYWYIKSIQKRKYTKQIPDILVSVNSLIYIIDAKYYYLSMNNISKMPGWDSIVKQMYYNISIKDFVGKIGGNVFLFPKMLAKNYSYIGYSAVEGKEKKFGYVLAYFVDIEKIWDGYLEGSGQLKLVEGIISDTHEILLSLKE